MGEAASIWASGNWSVKPGKEDEFVGRWREWLEWSRDNAPGFQSATLIRDAEDGSHFVSFSDWADAAAREGWTSSQGFREKFNACRELCDEFRGGDFALAARI